MITRRTKLFAGLASIPLFTGAHASAQAAGVLGSPELAGRWGGALGVGPMALRLVLEIVENQPVVLVSIDQSGARIPASSGSIDQTGLELKFASVRGSLKLRLASPDRLEGQWNQGVEQPISFTRLAPDALPAQPKAADLKSLNEEVTAGLTPEAVPALTGGYILSKQGKAEVTQSVAGRLTIDQPLPATRDMIWHIGSITKSMTATLVARLVERNVLSWDMTLGDAFGEIAPDMQQQYRSATLFQLMTGRTGMPTNLKPFDMIAQAGAASPQQGRIEWIKKALRLGPENALDKAFVYPNNGYVLAGALCELKLGKSYESLMAEEVFVPLGMASAGFGPPPLGNPQGHRKALLGGRLIPVGVGGGADNPRPMAPAGLVHISLPDLLAFGLAHSLGNQGAFNTYLSQKTWQFLHSPAQGGSYALGWVLRPDGLLSHNGSNTYWLAELTFDPARPLAFAAMANRFEAQSAIARISAAAQQEGLALLNRS